MKKILFTILSIALIAFASCDEPVPHVIIDQADSPTVVATKDYVSDNYDGEVPGLDAKVIDYTLPNPYQHKSQLLLDSTVATSWDKAGFPDAKRFIIFFKDFQLEVRDRKKESIADLIKFPLTNYKTREAFINNFDSIFMPDFVYEVLHQDPMGIYRDEKGAMIGNDGQIWFKVIDDRYRIVTIKP
jgi:hypothetical protein